MGATAAVIGVVVAAAGTAYTVKASNDARDDAAAEAKKQEDRQNALMDQAKTSQAAQESTDQANQAAVTSKDRQRALSAASGGDQGTILTSPTGIQGQSANTAGKTLLGT